MRFRSVLVLGSLRERPCVVCMSWDERHSGTAFSSRLAMPYVPADAKDLIVEVPSEFITAGLRSI